MKFGRFIACGVAGPGTGAGASGSRLELWLGLVLVLVFALYASHVRLAQLAVWHDDPQQYVASGVPMMTTSDAYYSLGIARRYAAGTFVPHGPAPQRHYWRPQQGHPGEWFEQREPKVLPLLSGVLAVLSRLTGTGIDTLGLVLSPVLSSLFMIPLFLCFWRLGAPVAGLMGGLAATFCIEYFQRTGVGWVDTDSLNLFFPWMASYLMLEMHGNATRLRLLLLCAAAGTVLHVFFLWYPKPGLTLAYVFALAAHLRLAGVSWRQLALCVLTLLVFANPLQLGDAAGNLEDFVGRYLWSAPAQVPDSVPGVRFPEVWPTISEVRALHWRALLERIARRADLAVIGLIAFVPFAVWRWRQMAPLAPLVLLGVLAIVSSRRFIPYLAPFVGIGWGLIAGLIARGVMRRVAGGPGARMAVACLAAIGLYFGGLAPGSGNAPPPRPAVPAPVFRDLQALAERLPAGSRIWTWWDLGFAIVDTTGFGVYHDGAAQYTPQTNLVAASFVHPRQRVMHETIAFVDREGNRGIRRLAALATDFDDLLRRMGGARLAAGGPPVYVLFTPDMMLKYSSMRHLGAVGATPALPGESVGIRWLPCERLVDDLLHCAGQTVDLRTGNIERGGASPARPGRSARLRRAVLVEGGRVLRQRDYPDGGPLSVQIVFEAAAVTGVYLLDEPAYLSNLNQMFFLGRFDPELFEEVFNDFPNARVFRVLRDE